jgi:hypothetical protein
LSEIRDSTSYTGPTDTTWNRGAIINHYSNSCWGMCGGINGTTSMTDNNGNLKKQEVYIPNDDQISLHRKETAIRHARNCTFFRNPLRLLKDSPDKKSNLCANVFARH